MAVTKYVQDGDSIDYTPGSTTPAGSTVVLSGAVAGKMLGIALRDITANVKGSVQIAGVFEFDKKSADVFAQGEKVYWDTTNQYMTTTSAGNTLAGNAVASAIPTVVRCQVKLPWNGV